VGLTLHYHLAAGDVSVEKAREYVENLRQKALDLPFQEVGRIVELEGKECEHQHSEGNPNAWMQLQGGIYVKLTEDRSLSVSATQIIGFTAFPGEGCESAEIGLATYPKTTRFRGEDVKVEQAEKGWSWGGFCKTQYASDPRCGGVKNFLRCHVTLIKLLDAAKELGILEEVYDEGEYWEKRDIEALAKEIGEWNQALAAVAGQIQSELDQEGQGACVEAPITNYPNFEHLEAEGRAARERKADERAT